MNLNEPAYSIEWIDGDNPSHKDRINLPELVNFDERNIPYPWAISSWNNAMRCERCLFIRQSDTLVGIALIQELPFEKTIHLLKLGVDYGHRRRGIGLKLMTALIDWGRKMNYRNIYLEVAEDNTSAIKLYSIFEAKVLHLKKAYYSDGRNALSMSIELI